MDDQNRIESQKFIMKKGGKYHLYLQFVLGLIILVLINIIGSYQFGRIDLTTEKRFSLSDPTKELINNLDDIIYVKVYLKGDFPAGFKRLSNATREMLDEFRAYGGGNIEYVFINPSENPNIKERNQGYGELVKQGLQPTDLQVKQNAGMSSSIIFPGAIIYYKDKILAVELLKKEVGLHPEVALNNSIETLEYEFISAISKLTKNSKP